MNQTFSLILFCGNLVLAFGKPANGGSSPWGEETGSGLIFINETRPRFRPPVSVPVSVLSVVQEITEYVPFYHAHQL